MSKNIEESKTIQEVQHIENAVSDGTWRDAKIGGATVTTAAQDEAYDERRQTILQAIRANPNAIMWSLIISTCVIMEGYDTILMGNFYAYPTFQRKFGRFVGVTAQTPTGYQLTAGWQSAIGQASGVGAFFGAILNGWLVNAYGPKRVVLASLVVLTAFLFLVFFANGKGMLLAGELLCGFPWGVFATAAPAYASEVLPLQLRIYFTAYTNMCFIIGQLIAGGIIRGLLPMTTEWGWRIPFGLQWFWPVVLFPIICFAPDSPWYLVRHGRLDEAEHTIRRLQRNTDAKKVLASIIYTNNLEEQLSVGTSYRDCFRGFELRRTEIACMVFAGQLVCGLCFAYASTYFFEQIGISSTTSYDISVGGNGIALFACFLNWFIATPYFGRRTIYVWGMCAMAIELCLIGILNVWTERKSVAYAQAILTLVWTATFQFSAGQLGWSLPAEVGSTRLRQKTVCLARNAYYISSVVGGTLENYFVNPQAWNLRGYTGFVWGGCAWVVFVWAFFRLPETKGRSFHELDILFAKNIPARQFASTRIDEFDEAEQSRLVDQYSSGHTTGANRSASIVSNIARLGGNTKESEKA